MVSDENITQQEIGFLNAISPDLDKKDIENLRVLLSEFPPESLKIVCNYLQKKLNQQDKVKLLELSIGMMLADGYITLSERYVIEFLSDLFLISPEKLSQIYYSITEKELPSLGDPSSPEWWEKNGFSSNKEQTKEKEPKTSPSRLHEAYATLGLTTNATEDEIKKAFRRLSQIHHPDRFQSLGHEAVKAATINFVKINSAYRYLVGK